MVIEDYLILGQIFCSRCASNIIKGSRLGHDGMLRVCNLCLEKLNEDDDDDDRRSVFSTSSAFPQGPDSLSQSFFPSFHHPFLGSQLFGRSDELPNLLPIAESMRRRRHLSGSDGSGMGSRPLTPHLQSMGDEWFESESGLAAAPFRRAVTDEEKDPIIAVPFSSDHFSGRHSGSRTPVDMPQGGQLVGKASKSTIQFPISSPDRYGNDPTRYPALAHSRVNSYGGMDSNTPFLRSRVQSRLDEFGYGDGRTRRVSTV